MIGGRFAFLAKAWNKHVFGNIFHKLKKLQEDAFIRNLQITKELDDTYNSEEVFWAQKARANWLQMGD